LATRHPGQRKAGTQVNVKIDDFFANDQKAGLEAGNAAWNDPSLILCAGVRFLNYDHVFMQSYTESPPAGELWWQRDDPQTGFNGCFNKAYKSDFNNTRAKRIYFRHRMYWY
jgi:hypothetical protein